MIPGGQLLSVALLAALWSYVSWGQHEAVHDLCKGLLFAKSGEICMLAAACSFKWMPVQQEGSMWSLLCSGTRCSSFLPCLPSCPVCHLLLWRLPVLCELTMPYLLSSGMRSPSWQMRSMSREHMSTLTSTSGQPRLALPHLDRLGLTAYSVGL